MIPRPELVELVIRRRDDHPDAHAVLCAGETVTWSQLTTLGLGIGANTTLYTWAKALLFNPDRHLRARAG